MDKETVRLLHDPLLRKSISLNGNLLDMRRSDILMIEQFKQSSDRNAKTRLDILKKPE